MDSLKLLGELSLGSRLKRLTELTMKTISRVYQQYGHDFDPYLFPAFHEIAQSKTITNTQLCEALETSQPAVTQTINKLVQKGLVQLEADAVDKRKKIISLTTKGAMLHIQVQPLWRSMDKAVKEMTRQPANSLLEHIDQFEEVIKSGDFSEAISKHMKQETLLSITPFKPEYAQTFYDLNIEWLETYFYVEDFDREVLSNTHEYILNPGGHIFFAVENGEAIGTVALLKRDDNAFELTKMAVRGDQRGKKLGQQLLQHCLDFAKENDFGQLYLYSNTLLENAIYIYRKFGFEEVAVEANSPYKRSNIKMVYPL
jgi:DNA-binding MarR family transcriptional regulator/N-acetylglutamate synthase-like GNAT family acetyltransferase